MVAKRQARLSDTRRFGGVRFGKVGFDKTRRGAEQQAENLRATGRFVRITMTAQPIKGYFLWSRNPAITKQRF